MKGIASMATSQTWNGSIKSSHWLQSRMWQILFTLSYKFLLLWKLNLMELKIDIWAYHRYQVINFWNIIFTLSQSQTANNSWYLSLRKLYFKKISENPDIWLLLKAQRDFLSFIKKQPKVQNSLLILVWYYSRLIYYLSNKKLLNEWLV